MLRGREVIGCLTLALILICPLALSGADTELQKPKTPIAHLDVQTTHVEWLPKGDYERLVLAVAGPGGLYIRQEFEAGQAPQISLLNSKGDRLADGSYTYELRAVQHPGQPEKQLVQSGFLSVQGGNFVDLPAVLNDVPTRSEPAPKAPLSPNVAKDIVHNDDLVVIGHACVGLECTVVNPGDPGLTLKEDLGGLQQIKFDNIGCCHPSTRDWAIQANDALNANGDFFIRDLTLGTIPFRIGGHAPDNAFYLMPVTGNIGLSTLTPAVRLDVKASAAGQVVARLQNSSATGHSGIHYLDSAGNVDLYFGIDNAASTTRLDSVNNNPILILTNSAERMRVTSTGNVGIGTSAPNARLEVSGGEVRFPPGSAGLGFTHFNLPTDGKNYIRGTTIIADNGGTVGIGTTTPAKRLTIKSAAGNDDVLQVVKSSGATSIFRIFETTSGDGLFSVFDNTGAEAARFTSVSGGRFAIGCNAPEHDIDLGNSSGTACNAVGSRSFIDAGSTTFTASSSRFIKENLKPIEAGNVLDRISAVKVYNYDFIEGPKDKIGLMAEDFHTIFGRGSDKMLNGQEVDMALWLAVQELTARNRDLEAHNQELAARNEGFEKRLADLEARLSTADN